MADPLNPNDPDFANNPNFVYVGGRWQYRGDPNAAPGPTGNVQGSSTGSTTPGEFFEGLANRVGGGLESLISGSSFQPGLLASAPGSELDTSLSMDDASRLAPFISALQEQSRTGGGAWESALKESVEGAQASASSLGQSMSPDVGYGASLRNMGNAQAAASQRGVGAGNILRAQTQQDASQRLADIFANLQANEAAQSTQQAGVRQGVRGAQDALQGMKADNTSKFVGALGQGAVSLIGAGMSDGGKVPGQPKVFGDDERNDTVPAMLSAGEIVIPRSITEGPDPVNEAAAFVAALKAQDNKFDAGGTIPDVTAGPSSMGGPMRRAASVETGAVLDRGGYDAARSGALGNIDTLGVSAMGGGPSVAPQLQQNTRDATMAQALSGQKLQPGALTGVATSQVQGGADAAGVRAQEQSRAMGSVANALAQQRAQDLAFAKAQQEALWRNSMMNAGIDIQQMAQLRGLFSGAGQSLVSLAGADGGSNSSNSSSTYDTDKIDSAFGGYDTDAIDSAFAGAGDFNPSDVTYAADGGEIRRKGTKKPPRRPKEDQPPTYDQGSPETDFLGFPKDKTIRIEPKYTGYQFEDDQALNYARGGEVQKARDFLRMVSCA